MKNSTTDRLRQIQNGFSDTFWRKSHSRASTQSIALVMS